MKLQMGLRQELRLELRMEQRLKQAQLQQYLAHDFHQYINLEDGADYELLKESMPFLVLHEVSHPLYDDGEIVIP